MRRRTAAQHADPGRVPGDSTIIEKIKTLDVYPKTLSEFKEQTREGGAISVAALTLIVVLVVSELAAYSSVSTVDHLSVDMERHERLRINLNITFPSLPCAALGLVTMDVAGEQQVDVVQTVHRVRLLDGGARHLPMDPGLSEAERARLMTAESSRHGEPCGRCYLDNALQKTFVETVTRAVAEAREQGRHIPPVRAPRSGSPPFAAFQRTR